MENAANEPRKNSSITASIEHNACSSNDTAQQTNSHMSISSIVNNYPTTETNSLHMNHYSLFHSQSNEVHSQTKRHTRALVDINLTSNFSLMDCNSEVSFAPNDEEMILLLKNYNTDIPKEKLLEVYESTKNSLRYNGAHSISHLSRADEIVREVFYAYRIYKKSQSENNIISHDDFGDMFDSGFSEIIYDLDDPLFNREVSEDISEETDKKTNIVSSTNIKRKLEDPEGDIEKPLKIHRLTNFPQN